MISLLCGSKCKTKDALKNVSINNPELLKDIYSSRNVITVNPKSLKDIYFSESLYLVLEVTIMIFILMVL